MDYASITPVDPEVEREILKARNKFWANPSSLHKEGEEAKEALKDARKRIARILHCRADEIFFTSGGTESLNLAILGACQGSTLALPHVVTSTIEHPAVLEPIKNLVKEGKAEVTFVIPDEKGIINPESIKKEMRKNTILIAIQHANNEIGTIQPIRKIKSVINNVCLLVDTCQSVLYEDVSLERLGADILVLDGIKMYGPRGIGVLAIKHGTKISPVIFGGGQEGGIRPGTENVPAAMGLAKALETAVKKRDKESTRLKKLRDYAIKKIIKEIPRSSLNGGLEDRLPNNINVCFPGADSEFLVIKLDTVGFAVSAASACHSLNLENASYVIESVSGKKCASSSLRITLGRDSKKGDLDKLIIALKKIV